MIIAVEGIDGAGKNTLVRGLCEKLHAQSLSFPQYDRTPAALCAARALHGQLGDTIDSPYAMATLFALDRAEARDQLLRLKEDSQRWLVVDRYVASNAAYSWARTGNRQIVDDIADLEFDVLGLPEPDITLCLDIAEGLAARRVSERAIMEAQRTRDAYEKDADLQSQTMRCYRLLAVSHWHSRWTLIDAGGSREDNLELALSAIASQL